MDMGLEEASRGRSKWGFLTQGRREGQEVQVLERQLMHGDSEKLLPLRRTMKTSGGMVTPKVRAGLHCTGDAVTESGPRGFWGDLESSTS